MKMDKDVLLICQYFHPEYVSSAQLPFDIASDMASNDINVGVLTGFPKEYSNSKDVKTKEIINNVKIKRLKYLHLNRANMVGRLVNYFSFTVSILFHLNEIKGYKAVMIFSNPPILPFIGVIAKKVFKTKFIFVSYDVYPEIAIATQNLTDKSIISKLMKSINHFVFKNVDKVVTLSSEMTAKLLSNRGKIKAENLIEIPNWDTTEYSNKSITNDKFKHLENKLVISYLGNLGTAQDEVIIYKLLNDIKNDYNIHFVFAGHGNKVEKLKRFVEENDIKNVSVYGFLQGTDFEKVLDYTDYSIVSLKNELHGLAVPSKSYTLLKSGIPILASMDKEADLVQDLLKFEAGFYVNRSNISETLSKLKALPRENYKKISENAKVLYNDNYSRTLSTKKYIQVFKDLVKE